jgi:hypothetical protein
MILSDQPFKITARTARTDTQLFVRLSRAEAVMPLRHRHQDLVEILRHRRT